MNQSKKRKVLEEIVRVCADNATARNIRRTMENIEYIMDNE